MMVSSSASRVWTVPRRSRIPSGKLFQAANPKENPDGSRTVVSRHDAVLDDGRAVPAPPSDPANAPVDRRARARAARTRRGAFRRRSRGAGRAGAVTGPYDSTARARGVAALGASGAGRSAAGARLDAVAT